jgi:hypothetical protein
MGKEATLDRQFEGLIDQTKWAKVLGINVKAIRPCVASMRTTGIHKNHYLNRGKIASIISCELIRSGYIESLIMSELIEWNGSNIPPLKTSELRSTLKTAITKKYNYTCHNEYLKEFCIGDELCSYSKGLSRGGRHDFRKFFTCKWPMILKNSATLVYWLALPEIEKRNGFKAGSQLFVGHREIAEVAGIETKSVKSGLIELTGYGLIQYKPGTSRKWERKASEVQRILPIPKPTREALLKVK